MSYRHAQKAFSSKMLSLRKTNEIVANTSRQLWHTLWMVQSNFRNQENATFSGVSLCAALPDGTFEVLDCDSG